MRPIRTLNNLLDCDIVGIDFDGTLVDGETSLWIANWVHRSHRQIDFHIITNRSGTLLDTVADELERQHQCLDRSYFKSIVGPPQATEIITTINPTPERTPRLILPSDVGETLYTWKGATAKHLGCDVLIDDMPELCRSGCYSAGVSFLSVAELKVLLTSVSC